MLSTRYCCPNCRTNRSRFNIIEQNAYAVKLDPQTGEVVEKYVAGLDPGPFHKMYTGPERRLQCAVCGLNENEQTFIKFGEKLEAKAWIKT